MDKGFLVTLLERDILAVLLSLNTVFVILLLPIVPTSYDLGQPLVYLTALAWGLPVAAIGVWWNHWVAARERG